MQTTVSIGACLAFGDTGLRGDVRGEWDEVKQHDVLFLITIRPPTARQLAQLRSRDEPPSIMEVSGLVTVRGAEVIEIKDEGAHASCMQTWSCSNLAQLNAAGLVMPQ